MKAPPSLFAIAALAAVASSALVGVACAQATAPAPRPTISAVELAPEDPSPGGQFVWLYNPSSRPADIACYRLRSRVARVTLFVRPGTRIPAQSAITFAPEVAWLRTEDRVELLDRSGRLLARTPLLQDTVGDARAWLKPAGGDWRFGIARAYGKEVVRGKVATAAPVSCKVD